MKYIDNFLLLSGEDIPLASSNIIIHNPTIQEIVQVFSFENNFLTGLEFLFFSKEKLDKQEQRILLSFSDFEVLLLLLSSKTTLALQDQLEQLIKLFSLLFSFYDNIEYKEEHIILSKDNHMYFIKEDEFFLLKKIVKQMFPLKNKEEEEFNPQSRRAKEIAEKIKKGREKRAKNNEKQDIIEGLFENYISILAIGLKVPVNNLYRCTVYQLLDMFNRYQKKEIYDVHLKAQLAGATGMQKVDHWMM